MGTPRFPAVDSDTGAFLNPTVSAAISNRNITLGDKPEVPAYSAAPTNLTAWRKAQARAATGGAIARMVCIGDSTTQGATTVAGSWPTTLITRLAQAGTAVRAGLILPATNIPDVRWAAGTGWALAGSVGPAGGSWYATTSTTGTLYFNPGYAHNRVDIWVFHGSGRGTMIFEQGGTTLLTIDSSTGAEGWTKHTANLPSVGSWTTALHAPTGGDVYVLGMDAYQQVEADTVAISNWGQSGTATTAWATGYASVSALTTYAPDLTVIMLGVNDSPGTTVDTWAANIQTLITAAQTSGSVILATCVPSDPAFASGKASQEAAYRDAAITISRAQGIPLVDIYSRFGPYQAYTTSGSWWRDQVHLLDYGNADVARAMQSVAF